MNVTDRTKQLTGGEKESGSTDFLQKTWVVCVLALVCTFLWGSALPCIKLGYALSRYHQVKHGHRCYLQEQDLY